MTEVKFNEFYKNLNAGQKDAVDTVEGPVMVVAGPGTGKTQILTLRIANILRETQAEPENILALTFTEAGVTAMRRRLTEIIGSSGYSVVINTFHGFCNEIIKNYPGEFPRIIGAQNITEVDQIGILEGLVRRLPLRELKPFGNTFHYVVDILSAINSLKREGVDPAGFQRIVKNEREYFDSILDLYHEKGPHKGKMKGEYQKLETQIRKNEELTNVYAQYEEELRVNQRYDYNDMIMEVLRELSTNQNLLLMLQEQHQYILIDEHQDTNNAQNKVLELLCNFHPNPNLFVVGDEKQAIFRFQGASLENFNYFKKLYPNAKLVVLEENYRSSQMILDSAESVIQSSKPLHAKAGHKNQTISVVACSRPEVEGFTVAKEIEKKLKKGVAPEEIAVLYRDNKDSVLLARMFEKIGIPFSIESDQNILGDADIKKIQCLLTAVNQFGSDEWLLQALHIDFINIPPLDVYKLIENANREKVSAFEILKSKPKLQKAGIESEEAMTEFYKKLSSWATLSKNRTLPEFFEILIRESGFLSHILGEEDAVEKLEKLNGFFDEVKSLVEKHKEYGLKHFLEYLNTLSTHNLQIKKSGSYGKIPRVRLMTAHRSKGQEFEYVFITNAFDGHWGNKRRPNLLRLPDVVFQSSGKGFGDRDDTDDERRLFYVALTRAKKEIIITYSKESDTKREQLPSQFIKEIRPEYLEEKEESGYEKEFGDHKEILFAPSQTIGIPANDKAFIKELFLRNGLSVTALNNYLRCPWNYFYNNLFRIPGAKTKHQMYGTVMHATLKDLFDSFKVEPFTKETLIQKLVFHLNHQPFSEHEYKEALEKGTKSLSGYFDAYEKTWKTNVITEKMIWGILLTKEIKITGKIDKMEFLGEGNEVNVVDYKTGRPKSRGEIEGSTQNSNGDMKRQLVFYNLLLEKYEAQKKFKMVSGDIDFMEPDEKGKYKKESFEIQKEEIKELEELIKKTADEILNVAFWNTRCEKKDCEYCVLREMMR